MKQLFKAYKHHLMGALVLISILAIFVPAILKSSADGLEKKMTVSLQLPPKPAEPQVVALEPQKVIQTASAIEKTLDSQSQLAQIPQHVEAQSIQLAHAQARKNQRYAKVDKPLKPAASPSQKVKKMASLAAKNVVFAVQLGTFSMEDNAKSMVSELKQQGYPARYQAVKGQKGNRYKVIVGALKARDQAEQLKEALADKTKLKGFVVQTEVS